MDSDISEIYVKLFANCSQILEKNYKLFTQIAEQITMPWRPVGASRGRRHAGLAWGSRGRPWGGGEGLA